jgi:hypothetical protein
MEQEDRLATPSRVVSDVYENDALRDGTVELENASLEFRLGHRGRAERTAGFTGASSAAEGEGIPEAAMIYAASRVLDARIHEAENEDTNAVEALQKLWRPTGT